jgi:hypothetical protein
MLVSMPPAFVDMGTLEGFPNPPALWLRQAKPAYAYAIMGTPKGFRQGRSAPASRPATPALRAASPNPPATLRCRRGRGRSPRRWGQGLVGPEGRQAPHATNPPNTSQPPWKSSTRAAGVPRPCWLSWSIYVKRLSLTVGRLGTPACAGAWEDKQQLELKPCCLLPLIAIPVPASYDSVSGDLSYQDSRDFMGIPEPQPRHTAPSPTTLLSGLTGVGRRNLQG